MPTNALLRSQQPRPLSRILASGRELARVHSAAAAWGEQL